MIKHQISKKRNTSLGKVLIYYYLCFLTGTTEKIFESKHDVYDAYVDNQNIRCKPHLSYVVHTNSADKERLRALDSYRCSVQ